MKKIIALILAVVMCMSLTAFASAEAAVQEISWADFEAKAAEMDPNGEVLGLFTLDEDNQACAMWVPSVFQAVELTDEDFEEGMLCVLVTEDESAAVEVYQMDIGEGSLEEFAAVAGDDGFTDIELGVVNGISCLTMTDTECDAAMLVFTTDAGVAVAFAFYPISDEGFAAVATMMMTSIQIVEW